MLNLKDFINSQKSKNQSLLSSSSKSILALKIKDEISSIFSTTNKPASFELERFSEGVTEIVQSENFIAELSDNIGAPFPKESEDAFVNRATKIMNKLLTNKLTK